MIQKNEAEADGVRLAAKHLGQALGHFLLPCAHLHRMRAVRSGDRVHRLDAFQGFKPDLGFKRCAVLTSLFDRGFVLLSLG